MPRSTPVLDDEKRSYGALWLVCSLLLEPRGSLSGGARREPRGCLTAGRGAPEHWTGPQES